MALLVSGSGAAAEKNRFAESVDFASIFRTKKNRSEKTGSKMLVFLSLSS